MSEAGIPDSPGRKEIVEKMTKTRTFKATFRAKKTGLVTTQLFTAKDFQSAFKEAQKDSAVLISLLEQH